jgi:hypothetical protein
MKTQRLTLVHGNKEVNLLVAVQTVAEANSSITLELP